MSAHPDRPKCSCGSGGRKSMWDGKCHSCRQGPHPRTLAPSQHREPIEADREAGIRIAIWNAARKRGMSQDACLQFVESVLSEPTMKSAFSTPAASEEWLTHAAYADALAAEYEAKIPTTPSTEGRKGEDQA